MMEFIQKTESIDFGGFTLKLDREISVDLMNLLAEIIKDHYDMPAETFDTVANIAVESYDIEVDRLEDLVDWVEELKQEIVELKEEIEEIGDNYRLTPNKVDSDNDF